MRRSIYRGVNWHHPKHCLFGKWVSIITVNGHTYMLGRYDSELEAAMAYDKKAVELLGVDAKLNFIEPSARAEALQSGGGLVTITVDNLEPELRLVLSRIIELAKIAAK